MIPQMIPLWLHYILSTLSFVLTLLFISFLLREKKPAGSTLAWLFLICLIPYIGIPLYLFLSNTKTANRQQRQALIRGPHLKPVPDPTSPVTSSLMKVLGSMGATSAKNNRSIHLLSSGERAFNEIIELISAAKKSISITTFIFANDEVGRSIVQRLTEQAARGIAVKVIVDSLGASLVRLPSFADFKRAGGQVAYFKPLLHIPFRGRTNLRNHRKLLLIDDQTAVVGGMNLAQEYLGPVHDPSRWLDLAVVIEGGIVADLQRIFQQDWSYATGSVREKLKVAAELAPAPATATATGGVVEARASAQALSSSDLIFRAQVVASGPDVRGYPLYDALISAIYEAKERISIVSPYFVPDESLVKALELACKRGVCLRILMPRRSNHLLADFARGSFVRQLEEAGAEIELYPQMIHAKAVVIDEAVTLLGSANFDMRSLLLNYELGVFFYDPHTIQSTLQWIDHCVRNSARGYVAKTFWRELLEGVGRVLGPVL
jgi:cardiolipin synthase